LTLTRSSFYMGVDPGQSQDYTAIVIIKHVEDDRGHEYHVRDCKRLPLGTSYYDLTKYIKGIIRRFEDAGKGITLIVDATGVGRPVIDSLKEDGLNPVAVTITSGQDVRYRNGTWHVPKKDLISSPQVMLGKGELKIAKDMPYRDVLLHELETFQVKVNIATGHDT
jgi:hypothetical protein